MTESDRIDVDNLPPHFDDGARRLPDGSVDAPSQSGPSEATEGASDDDDSADRTYSLDAVINEASKAALTRALQAAQGNCHRAADLLGVSRYTVYRMLNRYGMGEGRLYRGLRKSSTRPG